MSKNIKINFSNLFIQNKIVFGKLFWFNTWIFRWAEFNYNWTKLNYYQKIEPLGSFINRSKMGLLEKLSVS